MSSYWCIGDNVRQMEVHSVNVTAECTIKDSRTHIYWQYASSTSISDDIDVCQENVAIP